MPPTPVLLLALGLLACSAPPSGDPAVQVDSDSSDSGGAEPSPTDELIFVEGATFGMGCPSAEDPRCAEQHEEVSVDSFWIARYEARSLDYTACMEAGVCTRPFPTAPDDMDIRALYDIDDPRHPAVGIDWSQAKTYCEWRGWRLPTSAEWELAARGPEGTADFAFGDDFDWALCNGCDGGVQEGEEDPYAGCDGSKDGYDGPAPIDAFPEGASALGLEQVCGNQFEWTSTPDEAREGEPDARYIIRGGGWGPNNGVGDPDAGLLVWKSFGDPWPSDADHMGVRCAADADHEGTE